MALLPIFQTANRELSLMQTRWASILNNLLRSPVSEVSMLQEIDLVVGDNTIDHLQERALSGYIVVGMRGGFSQIYDKPSTMPNKTLILNSSAPVTIDLLVF